MSIYRTLADPRTTSINKNFKPDLQNTSIGGSNGLGGYNGINDAVTTPWGTQPCFNSGFNFDMQNWTTPFSPVRDFPGRFAFSFADQPRCVSVGGVMKVMDNGNLEYSTTQHRIADVFYWSQLAADPTSGAGINQYANSYFQVQINCNRLLPNGEQRFVLETQTYEAPGPTNSFIPSGGFFPTYNIGVQRYQQTAICCPVGKWAWYNLSTIYDPRSDLMRVRFIVNTNAVFDVSFKVNCPSPSTLSATGAKFGDIQAGVRDGSFILNSYLAADLGETANSRSYNPADYEMPPHRIQRFVTSDSTLSNPTGAGIALGPGSAPYTFGFGSPSFTATENRIVVPQVMTKDTNGVWTFSVNPDDRLHLSFSVGTSHLFEGDFVSQITNTAWAMPPLFAGPNSWDNGSLFYTTATPFASIYGSFKGKDFQGFTGASCTISYVQGTDGTTDFASTIKYAAMLVTDTAGTLPLLDDPFASCPWATPTPIPVNESTGAKLPDPTKADRTYATLLSRGNITGILNTNMPILAGLLLLLLDNVAGDTQPISTVIDANGYRLKRLGQTGSADDVVVRTS